MDERLRFVARGREMAELRREFDISRKTGYKIRAFRGPRVVRFLTLLSGMR